MLEILNNAIKTATNTTKTIKKIKSNRVKFPTWTELTQFYENELKKIRYIEKGYIKINNKDADIIIVISEYSIDKIKQLARLDLETNLKFRPLYFHVEYKLSENHFESNYSDYDIFYQRKE